MKLYMPTKLWIGEHCLECHAEDLCLGRHALIVCSAHAAERSGALSDVLSALSRQNITYTVYNKITQNPTLESCFEAATIPADFVIGIGGGSPMDAAKAIAVLAANPGMDPMGLYAMQWQNVLPIVCVGTTAGTGSEVTPVAVLTANGRKKSIHSDAIYPTVSFGDPRYTSTLSLNFTCSTAIDALAHCTESYFSKVATDFSRNYALSGLRILIRQFQKYDGSFSLSDRSDLYLAAIYGGLAIAITGTALPHALSYFLSESHGIPHGTACGIFLSEFLARNQTAVPDLYAEFFNALSITPQQFLPLIEAMLPPVELHLSKEEIDALAPRWVHNSTLQKTYGDVSPEAITHLLYGFIQ